VVCIGFTLFRASTAHAKPSGKIDSGIAAIKIFLWIMSPKPFRISIALHVLAISDARQKPVRSRSRRCVDLQIKKWGALGGVRLERGARQVGLRTSAKRWSSACADILRSVDERGDFRGSRGTVVGRLRIG